MSSAVAVRVEAATAADLTVVRALLAAAQLPVDDLDAPADLGFWVVREAGSVVGAIGLERFGDVGLLRSLVIAPARRDGGLGTALVRALERDARSAGVRVLVLLTQTAETFFRRHGYDAVDRAYAPDEVKASAEFRSLCPASAVCMVKLFK